MKKNNLATNLEGQRIYLKKLSLDMAQIIYETVEKQRARLKEFLPWVNHVNGLDDEISFLKSTAKDWDNGIEFNYAIFQASTNAYMGNIGVHTIKWDHDCAELGYWISEDYLKQGFMSEAVFVLENHLFEKGFHRVQIRCSDLNIRSANVPKRCGYTFEGISRGDVLISENRYRNTMNFSKLSTDRK